MSEVAKGPTHVWRADSRYRIAGTAALALLLVLAARLLMLYGYLAVIGVALAVALVVRTWWVLLRPKMTAGPDGVDIVHGGAPVHLDWKEIRRVEATPDGVKIIAAGGREVLARYPQQPTRAVPAGPHDSLRTLREITEADVAAAYLAQRAGWARKPTGPEPVYVPPPRPAKAVRK